MTRRTKCLLLLAATAGLWSLGGVIIKSVAWDPLAIASCRCLFAALTIMVLSRKTLNLGFPDRDQWLGAVCLAVLSIIFVVANKLTTAANVILLQYTAPVWVALLAPVFLKEKTRPGDWFFISLTFAGLALFFLDSLTAEGLLGTGLAAVNGLLFAGLALTMRRSRSGPPMSLLIYGCLLAAALAKPGRFESRGLGRHFSIRPALLPVQPGQRGGVQPGDGPGDRS